MSPDDDYRYSSYHDQQQTENNGSSGAKIAAGCGFGCLGMVLIVIIGVFVVNHVIQSKVNEFADKHTSDEPIEFAYPEVQLHEADAIVQRFDAFRIALTNNEPAPPLLMTADDINVIINHHPAFSALAGRAKVGIENNQLVADVNLEADKVPFDVPFLTRALEGKYVAGTATLEMNIGEGNSELYLLDFKVAEMGLPTQIIDALRKENLLESAKGDPDMAKFLQKVTRVKVEGNQLQIVPKNQPGQENQAPKPETPPIENTEKAVGETRA